MLIAGNWKMYKGPTATREFFAAFSPPDGVDVVICPQFGALGAAVESGRAIYAQNVHWAASGAFNLSGVKTAQDLDKRLDVLDALARANREARQSGDQILMQLRGELMAAGEGGAVQRELWLAQWASEVRLDDVRQGGGQREQLVDDALEHLVELVGRARGEDDVRPLLGQRDRRRGPDPPPGAGDDRHLPVEPEQLLHHARPRILARRI